MPEEITDNGVQSVFDDPETDLQPNHNVNPGNQTANDHAESPTIFPKGLSTESMRKEATVDPPKSSESDGSEGNSNPDYERRPSQEISKPALTISEDEDFSIDEAPQEGNSGDSEGDDSPTFEGGLPRGRIVSSVSGRPPPKPKPRPK